MARPVGQFAANKEKLRQIMIEIGGNGKNVCFAKTKTLATKMGCSERTVYRYLKALRKEGVIFTNSNKRFSFKKQRYESIRRVSFWAGSQSSTSDRVTYSKSFVTPRSYSSVVVPSSYSPVTEIRKDKPVIKVSAPLPSETLIQISGPVEPPKVPSKKVSLNPSFDECLNITNPEDLIPEGMIFVSGYEKQCWMQSVFFILEPDKINPALPKSSWEPIVAQLIERTKKALGK